MTRSSPHDDASLEKAIHERVVLTDHDDAWAEAFSAERDRLHDALPGTFVEIAHIGSTAVDGLRAKPVIDVLAGVRSMDEAFALAGPLGVANYGAPADFNAPLHDRQFFMRHADGHRTHHLHVVVHGSQAWRLRLHFRDRLRADADLRRRYGALKEDLVVRHLDDREAYTEAKSTFILAAVGDGPRSSPDDFRLHCMAQSGNAYKVALMLELSGARWTPLWVDFFSGATRTGSFKDTNVMAEVPVLEHTGRTMSQSGAILDYLSGVLGRYGPSNEDERLEILRWLLWDNHKFTAAIATLRWLLNFAPAGSADPAVIAFLRARMQQAIATLAAHLAERRYVVAERLTIADLSIAGYVYFAAEFGVDWTDFPAIDAWTKRIAAEPRWKHPYDLMPGHPLPRRA